MEINNDSNLGNIFGALSFNSGTLQVDSPGEVDSVRPTTLGAGGGTFTININGLPGMVFSGSISGAGALTKAGPGTMQLAASNGYSGGTNVNAGVLQLGASSALGVGALAVNTGGTLDLNSFGATATTLNGLGTIVNSASGSANAAILTATAGGLFGGTIQDGGLGGDAPIGLTVTGGSLTLSGTNSYTGGTIVSGGTLNVTSSYGIADGTNITVGDATFFPAAVVPTAAGAAVSPVPEPTTLALLIASAAGGLLWTARRRGKARR